LRKLITKNKQLIENYLSLSSIQLIGYLVPLIVLPYLVRNLGIEEYGHLVFVQVNISYFVILVNYGFNLSATNQISKNLTKDTEIVKIFSSVIGAKIGLFLIAIFLLVILLFISDQLRMDIELYIVASLFLVANIFSIDWFFQGVQKMYYLTIGSLSGRIIYLILILSLVSNENDLYWAVFSYSISALLVNIVLFLVACKMVKGLNFIGFFSLSAIKMQMRNGFYIFSSQFFVSIYSSVNLSILGFFGLPQALGVYAIGEKIYKLLVGFAAPVAQAVYPHMAGLYADSVRSYSLFSRRISLGILGFFGLIGICVFLLAPYLILIISGTENNEAVLVLRILSMAFVFSPFGGLFTQMLIIQGLEKRVFLITIVTALVNLIFVFPLTIYYSFIGTAISVLISAFLVIILALHFIMADLNVRYYKVFFN